MVVSVTQNELFSLFDIKDINELEDIKYLLSPSVYEYHLKNLVELNESVYLNKALVENSIFLFDNYVIHQDYDKNFYIEVLNVSDTFEGSLF